MLSDQANLLLGAAREAPKAFVARAKSATGDQLGQTTLEVAGSVAIGAAFALALKKPQVLGRALAPYVEGTVANAGKIFGAVAVYDIGSKVGVPAYDLWKNPNNFQKSKNELSSNFGHMAFDYPLMAASGLAGFGIGGRAARFSMRPRPEVPFAEVARPLTFDNLSSQLKSTRASEQNVVASVRVDNFLGRGSNGAVYKLDFTDDFVVKVAEFGRPKPQGGKLEPVVDAMPDHNVGQSVAKMGDYEILKKQNGFAAGAPSHSVRKEIGLEAAEALFARSIKSSAELPQAAYDDLARTMMAVEKHGMQFDPSKPGNILIDPVGKRFNLVDIGRSDISQPYRHTVADIIVPLVDNYFVGSVLPNKGSTYQQLLQQIITKSTLAAEAAGMHKRPELGSSLSYSYKLAGLPEPVN